MLNAILRAEDIHKSFGNVSVLKGVSLELHKSERIALIGSSGSGKSTFLRCLNYIERPSSGHVYLDGELFGERQANSKFEPMTERELARQRRRIGMVFQNFNLWPHLSALDNVAISLHRVQGKSQAEAKELASIALRKVHMQDRVNHYPDQLSGGQQQRVAIARALAQNPSVILFDEPTSALDPELVGEVLRVIHELAEEGCSMILVTHEINFASNVASHIAFMDEGRIVEMAEPKKLLNGSNNKRLKLFLSHVSAT